MSRSEKTEKEKRKKEKRVKFSSKYLEKESTTTQKNRKIAHSVLALVHIIFQSNGPNQN